MKAVRKSLAEMFPSDPLIPEMEAACARKAVAYGVYLKCRWWRLMWEHNASNGKHLRAYFRNPAWPAKALELCLKYHVPTPTWVLEWATDLAHERADAPTPKNWDTARSVERAASAIAEAMYTKPPPRRSPLDTVRKLAEAAKLNSDDARRLRTALLEVNDAIGFPRTAVKKRAPKTGKN